MKEIMKVSMIAILIIVAIIAVMFATGMLDVFYKNTVGVADANADRNVYKEGQAYQEGMIDDLSDLKLQLDKEQDPIMRTALIKTITSKFANFSPDRIENQNLRDFLIDIQNGGIK
jgi:hypothetical protein